jgi:protease II
MATNLLKRYPELLEIMHLSGHARSLSLRRVFDRDIQNNPSFRFKNKQINPTTKDGEIPMDTLFNHLITMVVDEKTKKREFDIDRSVRLHWIKYHVEERKSNEMLVFSCQEPQGVRTYIYDKAEKYVIILEPYRNKDEYYLLTAYHLTGRNTKKIENKYKRKLNDLL